MYVAQESKHSVSKQAKEQWRAKIVQNKCSQESSPCYKNSEKSFEDMWPFHGTNHKLKFCRGFRTKPLAERLEFI